MVDPVRWATPGTEVVWARYPELSARSTIQSASTPPPSPPIARMAMLIERAGATPPPEEADCDSWLIPMGFSGRDTRQPPINPALQQANHSVSQFCFQAVPCAGVGNDLSSEK